METMDLQSYSYIYILTQLLFMNVMFFPSFFSLEIMKDCKVLIGL